MNFFGHAVVAHRLDPDPEFVLGAMLPDFEGMVATSANRFTTQRVNEGVEAHHATDHVFHSGEPFLRHQARARLALQAAGLRTGPRRGVAHVGVELLLDAALGALADRTPMYKSALLAGLQPTALAGAPLFARAKLTSLLTTLRARAAYVAPKNPSEVVARLERIFAARPALSLQREELPLVEAWAKSAWTPIATDAEDWLSAIVEATSVRLNLIGRATGPQAWQTQSIDSSPCTTTPRVSAYDEQRQ